MRNLRLLSVLVVLIALSVTSSPAKVTAGTEVPDTILVSRGFDGSPANERSLTPVLSADGSRLVFWSYASNLVEGDTNDVSDAFLYDVDRGSITLVNRAFDGSAADEGVAFPVMSLDGSTIAYRSEASNLVEDDTNGEGDVFTYEAATATTTLVSRGYDGADYGRVSSDASTIVFDSGDLHVYDVDTELVVRSFAGWHPTISGDGSLVVFHAWSNEEVPGPPANVFVHDVATATTELVSRGLDGGPADGDCYEAVISDDGSLIVFTSEATNLVEGDTNHEPDVFAYHVDGGAITLVSRGLDGTSADGSSGAGTVVGDHPKVSSDGSTIIFRSTATNLDADYSTDTSNIFTYDVPSQRTMLVSRGYDGEAANNWVFEYALSADGLTVAYNSQATNLTTDTYPGDEWNMFITTPHGRFHDDDGSIFEADIEWLAWQGITKGCNPPDNDMFCPDDFVTRGQMAALLVRALAYADDGGGDLFVDDDDSIFETDIDKLKTAGVTKGCNPPDNTMYCPASYVTRGQMAAFLVRALGYTDDGGGDLFVDDDDSIFETDIDKLGAAGVTLGCNPPDNTRYCPASYVTRGQMAAFLHRALGAD